MQEQSHHRCRVVLGVLLPAGIISSFSSLLKKIDVTSFAQMTARTYLLFYSSLTVELVMSDCIRATAGDLIPRTHFNW